VHVDACQQRLAVTHAGVRAGTATGLRHVNLEGLQAGLFGSMA
jgi:hypothetical protein